MAKVKTKTISLLVSSLYMPADLKTENWSSGDHARDENGQIVYVDNVKYLAEMGDKRLKYEVNSDMADFLIGRKQAIEVPADVLEG